MVVDSLLLQYRRDQAKINFFFNYVVFHMTSFKGQTKTMLFGYFKIQLFMFL